METEWYPYVVIECEGECGEELTFSIPLYFQFFTWSGKKRKEYECVPLLCSNCSDWFLYTEKSLAEDALHHEKEDS